MHSPPPEDVIAKLVGATVELVSFAQYVLHLSFEDGSRLSVVGPYRFDTADRLPERPMPESPTRGSSLARVLGASVLAAAAEADGTLQLDFSNGDRLRVYAIEPGYEAYTLCVEGKEYVG